jgi:hypothetical protein
MNSHLKHSSQDPYYPDNIEERVAYTVQSGETINIAALPSDFPFEMQLAEADKSLQWLMNLSTQPERRENEVQTRQAEMPQWPVKPQWVMLGRLRVSYMQVQQVLDTLHEGILPLTQPTVQAIIYVALREIGPYDDNAASWRRWKTDMSVLGDQVPKRFISVLRACTNAMQQKTRDATVLLLLGDVAMWVSSFTEEADEILRRIASTAINWVQEKEPALLSTIEKPEERQV